MSDSFNTTVANWQGVDNEPTAGSNNLVKSGGVKQVIDASVGEYRLTDNSQYAYYGADGTKYNNTGRAKTYPINVVQGDVLVYKNFINPTLSASNICLIAALDENGDFISESSVSYNQGVTTIEGQYIVPAGVKQIIFCAKSDASDAVVYRNGSVAENIYILDNRTRGIDGINDRLYSEQENNGNLSLTTNDLKDSHILLNISGDTIQIAGTRKVSDLIPVSASDVFMYKGLYNLLESTPAIVTYSNRETVDTTHCVVITSSSNGTFTVPSGVKYIQLQVLGLTSFKYINKSLLTDNLNLNNVLKELYLPISSADIADFNQVIIFKNYYNSDTGKYITGLQFRKANNTYANYYEQSDAPISDFDGYFANDGLKSVIDWSKLETNTRTAFDVQFINYQVTSSLDFNPTVKNHVQDGEIGDILEINEKIDGRHVDIVNDDLSAGDVTYYLPDGTTATNANRRISEDIPVNVGDKFEYQATNTTTVITIVAFDANKELILSKCVTFENAGTVKSIYTVTEGVRYIRLQAQDKNGNYIRLVNYTKGLADIVNVAKPYPTKITGFAGFTPNSAWTISEDKKSAICSKAGVLYRMLDTVVSHADKFNLCAKIVPVGETFECLIGKWANTSGTMFCLKFDGTYSYLITYMIVSQNDIRLSDTINLVNVSLASGKPVFVRIMKRTDDVSYYDVDITDMDGNVDHLTNVGSSDVPNTGGTDDEGHGSTTGYAWGQICMYMLSGTSMTVSDLSYGFPIKDELDLICLGHSYMEGNSIASDKDKRFAAIVCTKIGWDNTIILAQGGQSAASLSSIVIDYANWFVNAKYALISIGGNDCYDNPTETNINNCIANCTKIRDILVNAGIIPVWVVDSGWVANYQDGVDQISAFSDWLLSQDHYVDARGCFRTGNSNDASKYLADGKHPTVATHQAIANCIMAQAGYLFD